MTATNRKIPNMYATMNDWLSEMENFATRAERVPEGAMPWIETAWNLAQQAEREACAKIAETRAAEGEHGTWQGQEGLIIASLIRART